MDNLTSTLAERKQAKPKLYREAANEINAAIIGADVSQKRKELMKAAERPRVNLHDLEDVKNRTDEFLTACETVAVIPTFLGLCTAFGMSREAVYKFLRNNPGSSSAEFIGLSRETLANIMITASLNKASDPATTIFSLKNLHGFSDRLEIEPIQSKDGPLGPLADKAELERRILGSAVADEYDE